MCPPTPSPLRLARDSGPKPPTHSSPAQLPSFPFLSQPCSDKPPAPEGEGGNWGEGAGEGLNDADIDTNWDEAIETFDGMELPEELLRGIYAYGFEKPSAIQQRAIRPTILGRDLIAQAQSGTVSCARSERAGGPVVGLFLSLSPSLSPSLSLCAIRPAAAWNEAGNVRKG